MAPMNIGSFSGILAAFPLDGDGLVFAPGLLGPFHDGLRLLPDIVQDRGVKLERSQRAGVAVAVGVEGKVPFHDFPYWARECESSGSVCLAGPTRTMSRPCPVREVSFQGVCRSRRSTWALW